MSSPLLGRSAVLRISKTAITGENVGTGDGTTTTFTLDYPPVLYHSETIYIDGAAKTRDTDYTIDYETGEITFTSAPASGASITADYTPLESIGYAQGLTLGVDVDLVKEYKIGSDKPEVLSAGNKSFTVSIDMMYIDESYASKVKAGTEVYLVVRPAGTGAGKEEFIINNVVFNSWEETISQDGVIMESVSGEGKSVTIRTQ